MRARAWTIVAAVALIALEVWCALYLTPATTLTISVDEAYRSVSFGGAARIAAVGAIVAAVVSVTLSLRRRYSGNPAQVAIIGGSICAVFVVVNVLVGFGYISLYDADPGNFLHTTNWILTANMVGSILVVVGLIALAAQYFRRTWNTDSYSGDTSARA